MNRFQASFRFAICYIVDFHHRAPLLGCALAHYKALLQKSWDLKDAIAAACAADDRAKIEAISW